MSAGPAGGAWLSPVDLEGQPLANTGGQDTWNSSQQQLRVR